MWTIRLNFTDSNFQKSEHMTEITGKHLIAGEWHDGPDTFKCYAPHSGAQSEYDIFNGTPKLVDLAVEAATDAYASFSTSSPKQRADFLRAIASEIESRGDLLTKYGCLETALPEARLNMERGRTIGQLNFFANWIEEGSWLQARIETKDPERTPLPKPDIRSCNKAIGPVAVFGASNFPLAFSTAGGDTASALAAGCPVVVKAHPAHPATCELIAQSIAAAIKTCGLPSGVFNQIQGGGFDVGQRLVAHEGIKAVGFTGSLKGGRALFDIAVSRDHPIPFYGELGSNNPMFLLPSSLASNAATIGANWANSLTMGVGQFCTNPGVIFALEGDDLETFKSAALEVLSGIAAQPMLTAGIAANYNATLKSFIEAQKITCLLNAQASESEFHVTPAVLETDAQTWLQNKELSEEIFGPAAIIVKCSTPDEFEALAKSLLGQLTATLHLENGDLALANQLRPLLEDKSGRVLVNSFPTGVEVCHSMVHGGPYPASTDVKTTSVGSLAIERFIRPVSYQDMPNELLPVALQNENPLSITRLINGQYSADKI